MKCIAAFVLLILGLATGCARYKYHAAPISPPALAHGLYNRSLDDSELRTWMQQSAGFHPPSWPLETWDLNSLYYGVRFFPAD